MKTLFIFSLFLITLNSFSQEIFLSYYDTTGCLPNNEVFKINETPDHKLLLAIKNFGITVFKNDTCIEKYNTYNNPPYV